MAEKNRLPERTCIGCMKRAAKSAMVRLAVADGKLVLDYSGDRPGRGAYLHRDDDCIKRFVASRVKQFRSLRRGIEHSERLEIALAIRDAKGL
ncbi:MAG TPA: YlxR family protein [Candidatus Binataceae bacterium]|nr:YlxR family protein [Candidatus Binataceae bacterium]